MIKPFESCIVRFYSCTIQIYFPSRPVKDYTLSKSNIFLLTILIFFSYVKTANSEVYRWVDEKGKIHFSDKPHANATQHKINAPKSAGIGISQKQLQRRKELLEQFDEKNKVLQQKSLIQKKNREKVKRNCKTLKNRLRDYEDVDFLYTRDENGQKKNLTDQQKKDEENKLRALIKEHC